MKVLGCETVARTRNAVPSFNLLLRLSDLNDRRKGLSVERRIGGFSSIRYKGNTGEIRNQCEEKRRHLILCIGDTMSKKKVKEPIGSSDLSDEELEKLEKAKKKRRRKRRREKGLERYFTFGLLGFII